MFNLERGFLKEKELKAKWEIAAYFQEPSAIHFTEDLSKFIYLLTFASQSISVQDEEPCSTYSST